MCFACHCFHKEPLYFTNCFSCPWQIFCIKSKEEFLSWDHRPHHKTQDYKIHWGNQRTKNLHLAASRDWNQTTWTIKSAILDMFHCALPTFFCFVLLLLLRQGPSVAWNIAGQPVGLSTSPRNLPASAFPTRASQTNEYHFPTLHSLTRLWRPNSFLHSCKARTQQLSYFHSHDYDYLSSMQEV